MASAALSPRSDMDVKAEPIEAKTTLTPPASEEADKQDDSGSDLSDLELDPEDSGEIAPDHYYEGGKIPVFKPTMDQFRSFKMFIQKIDKYGMKSGIVKVIPPKEWRNALPTLEEQVKTIKVKNPITQEFHGTHGTYTQANIEKQRSYNLPQWKALSEESNHQPPAKRGERRRNQEKITRGAPTRVRNTAATLPDGKKRGPGRPRVRPLPSAVHNHNEIVDEADGEFQVQVPPTPTSPVTKPAKLKREELSGDEELAFVKPKGRQPKSVSSRRKHNRRDQGDTIDEEAFKGFDYRIYNQNYWTPERCSELETAYWKSLTFNNPMYGADMPGSLFDESTESWNVAKLENLLDVLGQKVPGVNTAYLYLGMWKATFAWHLEDVDLYSINYIHFGAPKQWYSISQEDARRFEAAMRTVWPNDAKNCDQFLRHKTYLISPSLLQSQYNIKVNRLVHNEGEFVITFPYGYHSGYNLGYNCAESVNFATEAWLDYGRVAKKCNCEADSVWVDTGEIERKLRGEPTPEYYEETEEEDDEDEEDGDGEGPTDLPTPPASDKGKLKPRSHKRKRDVNDKDGKPKVKRLRIRIRVPSREPCVLCPNDNPYEMLLPTDNGLQAHRRCALYTPETYIAEEDGSEKVCDVARIDKARLELKCNFCRNKQGAVFQCSQKKCTRAYHATCAAAAGVQVDIGIIPVFGEDGTEYTDTGIDFRCRFHRSKRGKNVDGTTLEENAFIRKQALKLSIGEVVQIQYYQSEIFAGVVLENRKSEQALLVEVLPKGDKIEIEYKWLLFFDSVNSQLPLPSEKAKPLPAHLARKSRISAEAPNDNPKAGEPFHDSKTPYVWSEFHTAKIVRNPSQVKINISIPKQLWYYLGKPSTEARAQYTGDLATPRNNPDANFLESVRSALDAIQSSQRRSYPATFPSSLNIQNLNAARAKTNLQISRPQTKERPYKGKYAITDPMPYESKPKMGCNVDPQSLHNQRAFLQISSMQNSSSLNRTPSYRAPQAQMSPPVPMAPMVPMMSGASHRPPVKSSKALDEYHRKSLNSYYPPPQQQGTYSQSQVPVANMMGSNTSVSHNPFGKLTSSFRPAPFLGAPVASMHNTTVSPPSKLSDKYAYLQAAEKLRPRVYQSPYASEGGFTAAWLPNPKAAQRDFPRSIGLCEDFLMKRTPSQQEYVKTTVFKKSSEGKSISPEQQQYHRHSQPYPLDPLPPPSTQQKAPLPNIPPIYYHPQSYDYPYQHLTQYQPPTQQHTPQFNYPPQPGLQFQSTHDFQMQMQREAQQQDWMKDQGGGGYQHFVKGLQNVAGGHVRNDNPLKRNVGGGGSMLPMMGDRY